MYYYGQDIDIHTLVDDNVSLATFRKEIRSDLIILFSMLCNHLGVSTEHMTKYADMGCATLDLE